MWRAIDLASRFVYVALVPFLLPFINLFMPITGLLIGTGLATAIALVGSDAWRARVERVRFAGRFLRGMARFGDFYRQHPPKPLVYYVFYPLLLPVVLFMRVPRREFLLYRRMNALALAVVAATGAYDYLHNWRPELRFTQFLGATVAITIMEMFVTFMLITPIVTTLVLLRERSRGRTLSLLMLLMIATAGYGTYVAHHQHTMTILTWERLKERTKYARAGLIECEILHPTALHPGATETCIRHDPELVAMLEAVRAAERSELDTDALAAAHEKLARYYKSDEASAFEVAKDGDTVVVFATYARQPAIWLGIAGKHFIIHPHQLPPRLLRLLHL